MTSKAFDNATDANRQQGGRRNLIINGAMQVAQRGTSATGLTNGSNGYHTADRWYHNEVGASGFVCTSTIESDAPDGFGSSLKVEATTAEASTVDTAFLLNQRLEGQDLQHLKYGSSDAKSITVSFWVKSSAIGNYGITLYAPEEDREASASYTIDSTGTWEYKTITFEGDTSGNILNDNSRQLQLNIYVKPASSYFTGSVTNGTWQLRDNADKIPSNPANPFSSIGGYFQITGVQLEVGTVATPFEHRSYGEEEMLCRRYFQLITKSISAGDVGDNRIYGLTYNNSSSMIIHPFVPSMRAEPDLSYSVGGSNGFDETRTSDRVLNIFDSDDTSTRIYNASAGAEL